MSDEDYITKLATFKTSWTEGFITYYDRHLNEDILASYRPVLEAKGIYLAISGITNNPAESTNASFKLVTNLKNSSLYQTVSAWYFYQVDSLLDVCLGLHYTGNFVPNGKVSSDIYRPAKIKDVVDTNAIKSLVKDGKIPNNLLTNREYKSVSLHEATTLRGLARLFIEQDRVLLLPKKQIFLVSGLLDKKFLVRHYFRTIFLIKHLSKCTQYF